MILGVVAAQRFIAGPYAGNSITGQLDELRITKGVARNAAPYTPATGQFPNY